MLVFNMQGNQREKLRQELEEELQWIQYRQKMLDIMESKLFQIRELIEMAKNKNLMPEELAVINIRIDNLAIQVKALDSESRKMWEGNNGKDNIL